MNVERYTLDANILFYAIDANAGPKHQIAGRLWAAAPYNGCVLTVQAIAETYNAVVRKLPEQKAFASRVLIDLVENVPVAGNDARDLIEAVQLHGERPFHFWDAMLWATARRIGCATILTENLPDRPMVGGVQYRNPFTDPALHSLLPYVM